MIRWSLNQWLTQIDVFESINHSYSIQEPPGPLARKSPLVSEAQIFLAASGGQEKFAILDLPNRDFTKEKPKYGVQNLKMFWPPPAARKKLLFWTSQIVILQGKTSKYGVRNLKIFWPPPAARKNRYVWPLKAGFLGGKHPNLSSNLVPSGYSRTPLDDLGLGASIYDCNISRLMYSSNCTKFPSNFGVSRKLFAKIYICPKGLLCRGP